MPRASQSRTWDQGLRRCTSRPGYTDPAWTPGPTEGAFGRCSRPGAAQIPVLGWASVFEVLHRERMLTRGPKLSLFLPPCPRPRSAFLTFLFRHRPHPALCADRRPAAAGCGDGPQAPWAGHGPPGLSLSTVPSRDF